MRSAVLGFLLLGVITVSVRAEESSEQLITRTITLTHKFAQTIEKLKTKSHADKAKPVFDHRYKDLQELKRKLANAGGIAGESLSKPLEELRSVEGALKRAMRRIEDDPNLYSILKSAAIFHVQWEMDKAVVWSKLRILEQSIRNYYLDHGKYPTDLTVLLSRGDKGGPYLIDPDYLIDPWGRPFHYDADGARNSRKQPDIWSIGPAGDSARTLGNWANELK